MNYTRYHWCVASTCRNNSNKNPEKLFIQVPDDIKMRNVWLKLAKRDPKALSTRSRLYLCEDHFNLEQDMKNYMEYKIMGSVKHIKMKANTTPSRFCWDSESYPKLPLSTSQSTVKIESLDFVPEAENSKLIEDFVEPTSLSSISDIPIFEAKTVDKVMEVQTLTTDKSLQTEEIIARVYYYLQAEYEELKSSIGTSCDLSPLANILKRTAAAIGISEQTVSAILEEKKRAADDELDAKAAKRAKVAHDRPIADNESSCAASDKEQDDDNEQTDDDSQEQDECELKMEIKIEDEIDTFDTLQLQMSEMDSSLGHVISSASKFCSDSNTIVSEPVQVKIEPDLIVDPQPKPKVVPTILPVLQLRGSACEVTRVTTVKLYTPADVIPHSRACTSDMVCDGMSEPDVP